MAKAQLAEDTCAVTDPFCGMARGAKWVSGSSSNTVGFQVRGTFKVTSGAGGVGAAAFFPCTNSKFYTTSALTGTSMNTAALGTGNTAFDNVLASISEARVVSAGLTWWDISPATSAGGTVIINEYPNFNSIEATAITVTDLYSGTNSTAVDRRKAGSWISRPSNDTAYNYAVVGTDGEGGENNRTGVIIAATGAATTSLIECEYCINYEFTITALSALTQITLRKADKVNPHVAQVATVLDQSIPSFFEVAGNALYSKVKQLAVKAMGELGDAALAYLL